MEIQTGADAGTILIVEDDKEIRQGIEIFLKGQGYRVFQAADGIEGLKIIEEQDISPGYCGCDDAADGRDYYGD